MEDFLPRCPASAIGRSGIGENLYQDLLSPSLTTQLIAPYPVA